MSAVQKLTKKQKKALAFRERKGKGKAKALGEDNDVPIEENQDDLEAESTDRDVDGAEEFSEPKASRSAQGGEVVESRQPTKPAKRGREDDVVEETQEKAKQKAKRRKVVEDTTADAGSEPEEEDDESKTKVKHKQRFILFVGNLKYTTTREAVQKHFAICDPPPNVRLMTPKPSSTGKLSTKSKGFAFLEFMTKNALQQALKMHQSELEGRLINVELTAGGGGKSEGRLEKLKKRNRELHDQRRKRLEKQKGSGEGPEDEVKLPRPQRYSVTSGVDQAPMKKRTWAVGDTVDESSSKKRGKKGKKPPRALGTGVNAIPVG